MGKITEFIEQFPTRKFERNQLVLCQGEKPSSVYFIKSGFIKGYDISPEGNEQMLWFGTNDDFFPSPCLFDDETETPYFYGAFNETELYVVNRQELLDHLKSNNESLYQVTTQMSMRYYDMLQRLNAAVKPKASDKIVHMLKYIASRFSLKTKDNQEELALQLTHQDIANLLGLTRETVAVELKRLKDNGYLHYDKWHFVVFPEKLAQLT